MPYITTAQYPAIRATIDVTVTDVKLPDAVIASAPFHPAAEDEVTRRLGDLATAALTDSGAQRAVILLSAARLLPSLPQITTRRLGDTQLQYTPVVLRERVAELRQQAGFELAAVRARLDPSVADAALLPPPMFTVAPGGRAHRVEGTEVPGEWTDWGP